MLDDRSFSQLGFGLGCVLGDDIFEVFTELRQRLVGLIMPGLQTHLTQPERDTNIELDFRYAVK